MFLTIWLKNFILAKSPMGTLLDCNFFTHNFFFSYRFGHIWPFRSKKNSVRSKTILYDSIWLKNFNFCQKAYGKKSRFHFFYSHFFFRYLLGPREVSKYKFASVSSKIFLFDSIWLVFFLCQKFYGNTSLFRQIY